MDNELHILLNQRFNILLNSYKTLKIILIPNLPNDKNSFMKMFFDIILSQLNLFMRISTLKDQKKIFDLINNNIQLLSKSIQSFFNLFSNSNNTSTEETSKGKYLEFNYTTSNNAILPKNPTNIKKSNVIKPQKMNKNKSFEPLKFRFTEINTCNPFNTTQYDNNIKDSFTYRNTYKKISISSNKNSKNKNNNIKKNETYSVLYRKPKMLQDDQNKNLFNMSTLPKGKTYLSACPTNRSMKSLHINNYTPKITQSYTNIKNFCKISRKITPQTINENKNDKSKKNLSLSKNLSEKFSLNDFLTLCKPKDPNDTEKLYITKDGNIIITENQKNVLEKYINKCVNEMFSSSNKIPRNKNADSLKNIFSHLKRNSSKKMHFNDNSLNNGVNNETVQKLLNSLPKSFQKVIEDYIRKKRETYYNKYIFNGSHNTVYKNYETKLKIKKKNESKNKSRYKNNSDKIFVIKTEPAPTLRRVKTKRIFDTDPNLTVNNTKIDFFQI